MKLGNKHNALTQTLFILAILIFAITSLTHVAVFWDVANSFYLSAIIAIATGVSIIASLLSTKYTKLTYLSFLLVVIIELVGNIYACFVEIDVNGEGFKAWKELTSPLFEAVFSKDENGMIPDVTFKRSIAILQGSLIPILLSILFHMFMVVRERAAAIVKLENDSKEEIDTPKESIESNEVNENPKEAAEVSEPIIVEPVKEEILANEIQEEKIPLEITTPDNYLEVLGNQEVSLEDNSVSEIEEIKEVEENTVDEVQKIEEETLENETSIEVPVEVKPTNQQLVKSNILRNDEMGTIVLKHNKK